LSEDKKNRNDSFANAVLGSGIKGKDPLSSTFYKSDRILADQELALLYNNALVRKIIDTPAEEAVKNWIEIEGDSEECFAVQMLDDLNAEEHYANALRWSRLFGGSVILMTIDDGGTLEDPLNENNIMSVEALRVYDKREVIINDPMLMNDDPYSKNYGLPEWVQISPQSGGMPFYVHRSRILQFDGDPVPNEERARRNGWGLPTMQGMFDAIANNDGSYSTGRLILERISQAVIRFDGLNAQIESDEGSKMVQQRLDLIDLARSFRNLVALDKNDEFQLFNVPLTNVPETIDRFGMYVAALSNIPYTMLFGRNTGGLNANDQSQLENFYSFVGRLQKRRLKSNIDRLTKLNMLSKKGMFKGIELPSWKVGFCPLWMPSEKERAETEKLEADAKKAEADAINIYNSMGALDGSEVRQMLMTDSKYAEHMDGTLDLGGEVNTGEE
jgi:phage-related protein (TIGR01555 family)